MTGTADEIAWLRIDEDAADLADLQHLDMFMASFNAGMQRLADASGTTLHAEQHRLEQAHRRWLEVAPELHLQNAGRAALPACSSLVQCLLQQAPLVHGPAKPGGTSLPPAALLAFWPDGIAAFHLALRAYAAARRPDRLRLLRRIEELSLWWSIHENLAEEPGLARPFLELLAGDTPNWHYWACAHAILGTSDTLYTSGHKE